MWTPEEDEKVMALISKFRVGDCIPYTQVNNYSVLNEGFCV